MTRPPRGINPAYPWIRRASILHVLTVIFRCNGATLVAMTPPRFKAASAVILVLGCVINASSFGLMAPVSNGKAAEKGSFRFPQQQPRHRPLCQQQQQRGASRGVGALLMAADGQEKEVKPPREVILLLFSDLAACRLSSS